MRSGRAAPPCATLVSPFWSAEEFPFRLTLNTAKLLLCILKAGPLLSSSLSKVLPLLPPSLGPGDPTFAPILCVHLLCTTLLLHFCDRSHIVFLHFQLHAMVLLTPKFVFVALLASLTAFSLAPTADAAAIAMRRSHQPLSSDLSGAWSDSSTNHVNHPIIPLPARLTSAFGKQSQDRSGESSRRSFKVTCSSLILSVLVWMDC